MSTVKQSKSATPDQPVTGAPEPSTQQFTVVTDESIAGALAELDNLRTCRRLDEQTIAAQRKALGEARAALARANLLIGEAADEAQRMQRRIEQLEAEKKERAP